jgi:hypothetical protein
MKLNCLKSSRNISGAAYSKPKLNCQRRIVANVAERQHNDMCLSLPQYLVYIARNHAYLRTIIIQRNTRYAAATLALLSSSAALALEVHEYTVTIDADFSRLEVAAGFASTVYSVSARATGADEFLLSASDCQNNTDIITLDRRMLIAEDGIRCMSYVVDLAKIIAADGRNLALAESNFLAAPAYWLWRPTIDADNEVQITFELADGVRAAVPWTPVSGTGNTFRISASPENASAPAVFGTFEQTRMQVADANLSVTVLKARSDVQAGPIFDWVQSTANSVTLAYGRFPNPEAHIFVVPSGKPPRGDRPGLFGQVMRDGGEVIEFRINEQRPIEQYYGHWAATHEFSHLLLPYVYKRHRWISEGFAQYHQNVLLARAGTLSEIAAWRNLYNGFERGRKSSPSLSPNEAAGDRSRSSTMKVYWSGAVLALMADVELRRRSGGTESLDLVLDRLQRCCLPSARTWGGLELLTKLDSLLETPVFVPLFEQIADTSGFPDVKPLLERLGVDMIGGELTLRSDAEYAAIRTAITATRLPERD